MQLFQPGVGGGGADLVICHNVLEYVDSPAVALASIARFAALGPSRLLFSHYGPVAEVTATLERSAEEISVWVAETRAARGAGMGLDHAVEAVRQQTLSRYAAWAPDADPATTAKFDQISGAEANVGGIWHWLDRLESPAR